MKIKLQLSIENDDGEIVIKEELMAIERDTLCLDNLGLSLDEAKQLLAGVQQAMVNQSRRVCGATSLLPSLSWCA
jgi:hypothetical protein